MNFGYAGVNRSPPAQSVSTLHEPCANVSAGQYAEIMFMFDASQLQVLGLDPHQNARIIGAPGSGKTTLVVEAYARLNESTGWDTSELVAWAPTRAMATRVRNQLEERMASALAGTPVRTPTSFAFSVVQRHAALHGEAAPQLLTGTAHDLVIDQVLSELIAGHQIPEMTTRFSPEVIRSAAFRSEIRDLCRVVDDYRLSSQQLSQLFSGVRTEARTELQPVNPEQRELWSAGVRITEAVHARLVGSRAEELSSSELCANAAQIILTDDSFPVPKVILIDDAQELGEGALSLLSSLHQRGSKIWVFGDPDLATAAFHGERVSVLAGLQAELVRRGSVTAGRENLVTLTNVYRHGPTLRVFIRQLTARIGTAGVGQQREAVSSDGIEEISDHGIEFATVASTTEQLGAVAHRLRRRHLGLDTGQPRSWDTMAVICRSRSEVVRAARTLAGHQVPTNIAAGGVVLREEQLVRELILLTQAACDLRSIESRDIWDLLGGVVGAVDPVALRRLRSEMRLQEQRIARAEGRQIRPIDVLAAEAFAQQGDTAVVDARSGRQLLRLAQLFQRAHTVFENGGTVREVLWEIWDGTRLAEELQKAALDERGAVSDQAHRSLDAVMGLFFALQRHEEQNSSQPIAELLTELLESSVAEDTLAAHSERPVVTVTTPQGAAGRSFDVVCVLGPQDGTWPNVRARGSLLSISACERWLRGGAAVQPSRRDTLHDELRLFVNSCSRSSSELLVIAVADEENHPSAFYGFGKKFERHAPIPSSRLTLRGAVAEMRRRLTRDEQDAVALHSLVALADAQVPGANPEDWYGVRVLSSDRPLVDSDADPEQTVSVSPSRMEAAERCPLDWVVSQMGGSKTGSAQQLGTLLHYVFERVENQRSAEQIFAEITAQWSQLSFEAEWQSEQSFERAREMAAGLADYLSEFHQSSRELAGTEVPLKIRLGRATVNGTADRLELTMRADGSQEMSVVDLKTGASLPTEKELLSHAQLQAYQLGVVMGSYQLPEGAKDTEQEAVDTELPTNNGGARLLYVDPRVRTSRGADAGSTFRVAAQAQLSEEAQTAFIERVHAAAETMSAASFTAKIEHHCTDPFALGRSCALHIIPGVSHA